MLGRQLRKGRLLCCNFIIHVLIFFQVCAVSDEQEHEPPDILHVPGPAGQCAGANRLQHLIQGSRVQTHNSRANRMQIQYIIRELYIKNNCKMLMICLQYFFHGLSFSKHFSCEVETKLIFVFSRKCDHLNSFIIPRGENCAKIQILRVNHESLRKNVPAQNLNVRFSSPFYQKSRIVNN